MFAQLLLMQASDKAGEAAATALCGGFGILYFICIGLIAILSVGLLILWIMMLIDCIQREEKDFPGSTGNSKTIWLVVLLASWLLSAYWLAAILYYFMVKRRAQAPSGTAA